MRKDLRSSGLKPSRRVFKAEETENASRPWVRNTPEGSRCPRRGGVGEGRVEEGVFGGEEPVVEGRIS